MRSEIQCLENTTNRTTQQEQELQRKRQELARLEQEKRDKQEQQPKPTSYLPWILGIGGVLALIGIITYFLTQKKVKQKRN